MIADNSFYRPQERYLHLIHGITGKLEYMTEEILTVMRVLFLCPLNVTTKKRKEWRPLCGLHIFEN